MVKLKILRRQKTAERAFIQIRIVSSDGLCCYLRCTLCICYHNVINMNTYVVYILANCALVSKGALKISCFEIAVFRSFRFCKNWLLLLSNQTLDNGTYNSMIKNYGPEEWKLRCASSYKIFFFSTKQTVVTLPQLQALSRIIKQSNYYLSSCGAICNSAFVCKSSNSITYPVNKLHLELPSLWRCQQLVTSRYVRTTGSLKYQSTGPPATRRYCIISTHSRCQALLKSLWDPTMYHEKFHHETKTLVGTDEREIELRIVQSLASTPRPSSSSSSSSSSSIVSRI